MTKENSLKILAWLFSAAALMLIIISPYIKVGITPCAISLVFAIIFQGAYGIKMKKSGK
jgi:hypothetical protein